MPLGMEVGLGPGDFVLDGDPASPPQYDTIQYYKSSAVAEMGDRGHGRHGPKGGRAAVPLLRVAGTQFNTMWCLRRDLLRYKVASSSIKPFAHNRHEPKIGLAWVCLFFWRELGPHRIQSHLVRGLPPYQVAS